jgi:hypothetical protein
MNERTMEYTITPSADGTYIILKVKGNITRQSVLPMNLEAHALGRKLNIRKYFTDMTEARNVDDTLDDFEFAHADMRETKGIDKNARVVVLIDPSDHSHDFAETALRNAGHDITIFTDREEAERHLMDDHSFIKR